MLLTNKTEILEAMNKELAGASPSSIKWLADIFGVPSERNPVQKKSSRGNPVAVPVVFNSKQYLLKLNQDDILLLEKQNKAISVKPRVRNKKMRKKRDNRQALKMF